MNPKQRVFVEEYLKCWNAAEAARRAGYSTRTAYSIGQENLRKPEIAAEIKARLSDLAMSADETLVRMAEQARGEYARYIDAAGRVDLGAMQAAGKLHLIKRIKTKEYIDGSDDDERLVHVEDIEFVDSQAALFKIGQHHRLFTERSEVDVTLRVEGLADLLDQIYGT